MMDLIAQFVVSLARLITNPVAWFARKNWLVRLALTLVIVPAVSLSTLIWTNHLMVWTQPHAAPDTTQLEQRLEHIEQQISELAADPPATAAAIGGGNWDAAVLSSDQSILGASQAAQTETDAPQVVIFIPQEVSQIPVFQEPTIDAQLVTQIDGGNIFFVLDQQPDWYLISLDYQQTGWVQAEFAFELMTKP